MYRHASLLFICCALTLVAGDELPTDSTYGDRLADSSYVFNSVSSRDSSKEESSVYSSGINAILNSDGFLNSMTKLGGGESKYTPTGPVEAAVHTKKTVEVIPVRFEEPKDGEPQVIEITPYEVPLSIVFKTQTNKINVNQEHKSEMPEEVKETTSEEEPHRVVHNVYRPVIQEVTEVIQPFRKVLQKIEPVQETMKTIISKAGPPDGQSQQQQGQSGYSQGSKQEMYQQGGGDEGRFARFGGNDIGRGLSIIPIAYGSEQVSKKLSAPSSNSNENEISRRFGMSNRNRSDESRDNSKEEQFAPKAADYNEIIQDYITKFIEPKPSATNKPGPQINPNSIKMFNVPMKNAPNHMAKNGRNGEKPKFKIIKEFRVTLDDLKKLKLAPFVLNQKNMDGSPFPVQNGRNTFNGQMRPGGKWPNFHPMAESSRSNIYNSPKRMGDAPMPRHNGSFARRRLTSDRPIGPAQEPKAQLKGIKPANLMFNQEARLNEAFRRSSEEQAFFESKRLRA